MIVGTFAALYLLVGFVVTAGVAATEPNGLDEHEFIIWCILWPLLALWLLWALLGGAVRLLPWVHPA